MKKIFFITWFLLLFACKENTTQSDLKTGINPFFQEWNTPYNIPPFLHIKDKHYMPAFEKGMEENLKEIDKIVELISKYFNLERNKFDDLYRDAALIQKESTSFHNLTSKIHKKYSYSQKIDILEMLWEVIMINRDIDDLVIF